MTPIAASLRSLPATPPFVPGGTVGVTPSGMGPDAKPQATTTTTDTPPDAGRESAKGRPIRPPAATDAASIAEQRMLTDLKVRDREVRAHESAHRAAGGDLVRGGSYDYQQGPDGKRYAVGGDVQIDTTPVPDDARATADKMSQVIRAALAPAKPSPTDLAVAAQATAERNRAQSEARMDPGAASTDNRSATNPSSTNTGSGDNTGSRDATSAYQRTADQSVPGSNLNALA